MKMPWVTSASDALNYDPSASYAALNCNTCHGAHGSGNIHNLRTSITVGGVVLQVGGVSNMPVPARITDPAVYTLPPIDGRNVDVVTGVQTDHYWGAFCSFCHKMDAHPGKDEADSCTGGHMHGGGAF
jgi:cytochrome c553